LTSGNCWAFVFGIGSAAPHKNVGLVLDMADRLAEAGLRIAIVGMSDSRVFKSGPTSAKARNVHWLGRISDGELVALLGDSLCLAFPSLTEGFGLPALEAMAVGCPVVVSDRASLPEVCGNAALFAPPDDPEATPHAWRGGVRPGGAHIELITDESSIPSAHVTGVIASAPAGSV